MTLHRSPGPRLKALVSGSFMQGYCRNATLGSAPMRHYIL